ncbi:MAG: UPF0182 family protein [Myxococcota bacterium]|nr:UPF0182 family protein [Myxococcota bacterium]
MYWLLLLGVLGLGGLLLRSGLVRRSRARAGAGMLVVAGAFLFFALLSFWAEMLWFEAAGYAPRFWRMVAAKVLATVVGAAVGSLGALLVAPPTVPDLHWLRRAALALGSVLGGVFGFSAWDEALLFLNRVPAGLADPILGRDAGFYLFALPLLDRLYALLLGLALLGVALAFLSLGPPQEGVHLLRPAAASRRLALAAARVAVMLAAGMLLARYHLLYSEWGVVAGPGWTDVHVRLPAYWVVAILTLALGVMPLVPALARRLRLPRVGRFRLSPGPLATAWLAIAAVWLVGLVLVPNLVQFLVVEPNEITFEKPYIANNIAFTRRGFRLHEVEERQFPAAEELTRSMVADSEHLLAEARLWDVRALADVYRQFQEIRLYYAFHDVDIDRYDLGGRYRQVMVSARELEQRNLPDQSQTFVNRRFKYTHGYGLTLATVRDFTPDGLPNLLVKDIPPRAELAELQVERPQIYYGELTGDPAVVVSREPEFDHPSGDENVTIVYSGSGGVRLENLWRKFVFGWKFDGTRFFFSTYMTPETRILFHRKVRDRVATLAPFLEIDADPYVVLVDGRLYWIVDAYTTSSYYPYSEPWSGREPIASAGGSRGLRGANYVRNAVKVVVDAFDGTTSLYVFDPEDPLIRVWQGAFPGLFRDAAQMPPGLRAHVRYPHGFLLAQGLVYAKYHMADAEVFYNQEDLWVRATEKYYARVQPVEPYYVMWQLPGSERAEFVLILPFTPKNRQVLIGWIAGLSDGENYGRFLAYKFPKEKRVLGPQQVETKIDQDRFLSGQLTLWDQRGSAVIRGNVLAIPIGDTLLYVEPIYLKAETAAYPELRLVVLMHGDDLSYAETFEAALEGLFEGRAPPRLGAAPAPGSTAQLAQRANEAFEDYLRLQAEQRFEEAARALERLRDLLEQLSGAAEESP